MKKIGYVEIGALAGIVSAVVVSFFLGINPDSNYIIVDHIVESVAVMFVLGLIWDLISTNRKKSIIFIIPASILVGWAWQLASFMGYTAVSFVKTTQSWFSYGLLTIIFVGVPILFISYYIRGRKEIFGIRDTGYQGRMINFALCFVVTFVVISVLYIFGIYDYFYTLLGNVLL